MKIKKNSAVVILIFLTTAIHAQDSLTKKPFSFNTDLVSSYVWRGSLVDQTPNLQPYFSFSKNNFECGSWGSVAVNGDYSELDLYAAFAPGKFAFMVTDYYVLSDNPEKNYFDYANKSTSHTIEGSVGFTVSEKVPLTLSANTYFYGSDNDSDTSGTRLYSSYVEASYSFSNLDLILGVTPWKGY